ncbi:hypothetical protein DYB25_005067 [Aphanomyces astaci]|uniref:PH domain-containing protein n=2 Tax=Aphanomyces astaci TaxID=112090 RepID=A0A396ZMP4_APHAT|nr:hypothetical protein DYB25_005067 [Aphanomyces astaci]
MSSTIPHPSPALPPLSSLDEIESKGPGPVTTTEQDTAIASIAPQLASQTEAAAPSTTPTSPPPPTSPLTSPPASPVTISSTVREALSVPSPRHYATSSPPPSASMLSPRSNSFTKSSPHDKHMSPAMEWRNKSVSCDALRGFESSRKTYIDPGQSADRRYWELFCQEVTAGREHNARLVKFFTQKVAADLAYADSLRRLRLVLDGPPVADPSSASVAATSTKSKMNLQVASSCDQALAALGESQQLLCEKLEMFTNTVQRDVLLRPFQEMVRTVAKYEETVSAMLSEGDALDALLHVTQRRVHEAFAVYDGVFRDMERHRHTKDPSGPADSKAAGNDLWLAEMSYGVHVKRLQTVRVEYVKGMAGLFHQFKTLEVLRVSVTKSALDIFIRKQKLIFEELGNSMTEPLAIVQKIEAEKDLIQTIRRIPRNLIRCGFVKYQVTSTMFKTWKDMFGVITQDRWLHLFELNPPTLSCVKSLNEYILECLPGATADSVTCNPFASISLPNCRLTIAKGHSPTFEVAEAVASTGLFSVFKTESTKRHMFQCVSQPDLVDWVVAAKRLIPSPTSSHSRPYHHR